MKCNQSLPGFELVSPCPFPTTITITPRAPHGCYSLSGETISSEYFHPLCMESNALKKSTNKSENVKTWKITRLKFILKIHITYIYIYMCVCVCVSVCVCVCVLIFILSSSTLYKYSKVYLSVFLELVFNYLSFLFCFLFCFFDYLVIYLSKYI